MTTIEQLQSAKKASNQLRVIETKQKNQFLKTLADLLLTNENEILAENQKDLLLATGLTKAMEKRLTLTPEILKGMAKGLKEIAGYEDPIGIIEEKNKRPNGMKVAKMRVPIGVIVFVYESRPNVIIDAAGLCVKSGNALIVRGGKEANNSNTVLLKFIQQALQTSGMDKNSVQQLEDRSYEALAEVVKQDKYVDLVVPRGREKLINSIKDNARVPVIAHERGLCHMYIDSEADKKMAIELVINAKTSNPSTCNTIEKVLIHKDMADKVLPDLIKELLNKGVEVRGDAMVCHYNEQCVLATEEDWDEEYLDLIIAIKIVGSFTEALQHIEIHSSHLTDSIITKNKDKANEFLRSVNSASVLHNASNRLVDGGEFGLGAELGISTSSIHMRGPMGIKDLTVTKYVVMGSGQIR
ncbi:MAG: glutamate-5-semialdehyde dehydrogenase [Candidatus Magasanikiibacteriota bacterium]